MYESTIKTFPDGPSHHLGRDVYLYWPAQTRRCHHKIPLGPPIKDEGSSEIDPKPDSTG